MKSEQSNKEMKAVKEPENAIDMTDAVPDEIAVLLHSIPEPDIPQGEKGARYLLKRTPTNYLLNQAIWIMGFCLLIHPHTHHDTQSICYTVWCLCYCNAAFNTIAYISRLWIRRRNNYLCPSCPYRTWSRSGSPTCETVTFDTYGDSHYKPRIHAFYSASTGNDNRSYTYFWLSRHSRWTTRPGSTQAYHSYCSIRPGKRYCKSFNVRLCISNADASCVYCRKYYATPDPCA